MADIKFYNFSDGALTLIGVVDDFVSFAFPRSYSNIGEWSLTLNAQSLNAMRVKRGDLISVSDGVAGLITQRSESLTRQGGIVTISGVELKGIASQRITIPPVGSSHLSYNNKSPEYIIAQLITTQITAAAESRKIFGVVAQYTESADRTSYLGRFSNVAEDIQKLANTYNIGWCADIRDNVIVWHIYRGVDRRKSQSINSRMIISNALDSFGSSTLCTYSTIPNFALVAGQGEGVDRSIDTVGDSTGLNRSEVYIDARDITDVTLLSARGEEKLAAYGDSLTYEVTLNTQFIKQYKKPYDLGDIGTVEDARLANGEVDFVLTQITEVYENNALRIDAVFGYDKQGLKESIKRITGGTQSLVNLENYSSGNSSGDGCIKYYENLSELGLTTDNLILDIFNALPVGAVYAGWHGSTTNANTNLGNEMPSGYGQLTIHRYDTYYGEVEYRRYVSNTLSACYRCVCALVNGSLSRTGWNEPWDGTFTIASGLNFGSPFGLTYFLKCYPHNGMVHFGAIEIGTFANKRGSAIALGTLDSSIVPQYTQRMPVTSQAAYNNNTQMHYGMITVHGKDSPDGTPGQIQYHPFESTGITKSITFDIWYTL